MQETRTIVDIGGQDSKLVRLKDGGAVADFVMNDPVPPAPGGSWKCLPRSRTPFAQLESLVARSASLPRSAACASSLQKASSRPLRGGRAARGHRHRRANGDCHADRGHDRAASDGTGPFYRWSGLGARHGDAVQRVLGKPVLIASQPQFDNCVLAAVWAAERCIAGSK